ncbi:MAG: hypothetical protein V7K68_20890 [Nostoc sp.]|uniref:hypothetical protein n=1 Tax=Nostoc sp. TaxID=1180 RepID=UPI002FF57F0F
MIAILDSQNQSAIDREESIIEYSIKRYVEALIPNRVTNFDSLTKTKVTSKRSAYVQVSTSDKFSKIIAIIKSIEKSKEDIQPIKQGSLEIFSKRYLSSSAVSSNSSNEALKITQERLIELWQEDEEDEYGIVKPTVYAFDKAWSIITEASQFLKDSFRKASVSTDDEGGIRLTWTKLESEAEVRLICPCNHDKEVYLYHEKDSEYNIVKNVTGFNLASWLNWLNQV